MGGPAQQQATVPNPAISDLKSLKSRLMGEMGTLNDTLKQTNSDMGGKKVWVGKAADTWASDISGRRSRIQTLLGKLVPIIDAEINSLPEKVTPNEAKLYNMDRYRY
ncbi:hypothetical protein [Streptomyces sp. NRRL F-5123]|uniref:hypothetical protein n=1 Tax=Streptomyces sp. NRRL F-5123 TaxID=1463856 RepID=UPI00069395D6|nr:hypothetical protein [Streptomyces sp. NRRL F-5123]